MKSDTKVSIKIGCLEWMQREIEELRKANQLMRVELNALNRVLVLTESISPKTQTVGYGEDMLWQAKKDIEAAINEYEADQRKQARDSDRSEMCLV